MSKSLLKTHIIEAPLTYKIRKNVLWPHITNGNYSIDADSQKGTFHLGTFLDEKIISIGTFIKENNTKFNCDSQYRLRAMATDNNYRKISAGKTLFLKAINVLKNKNIELLWCDARIVAIGFYKSVNMQALEDVYNIPNIGLHQTMYCYLKPVVKK